MTWDDNNNDKSQSKKYDRFVYDFILHSKYLRISYHGWSNEMHFIRIIAFDNNFFFFWSLMQYELVEQWTTKMVDKILSNWENNERKFEIIMCSDDGNPVDDPWTKRFSKSSLIMAIFLPSFQLRKWDGASSQFRSILMAN